MTIPSTLETILASTRQAVAARQAQTPVAALEKGFFFQQPTRSLRQHLTQPGSSGIIAEFKRRSPSKGWIQQGAPVGRITLGYANAGAAAISVLTEEAFFGGSLDDLSIARHMAKCPVLRKDFMVDEYQVLEAKAAGADAILLIAAALPPARLRELGRLAHSLGLEVLLEVHNADELDRALHPDAADLLGVNSRNLHTFEVSLDTALELVAALPASYVPVAESGLTSAADVARLHAAGYRGFLIGELFMRQAQPEAACAALITELQTLIPTADAAAFA